jgi:hypothetical protein
MAKKVKRVAASVALVPHIRYQSPQAGHPILRRKGRAAYEAVVEFLERCTDWDGTWPETKVCVEAPDKFVESDERHAAIAAELARGLGRAKEGISFEVVDPDAGFKVISSSTERTWIAKSSRHDWAVDRVLAAPPARRGWPDAVSCSCGVSFRLRDPEDGRLLPGQAAKDTHGDIESIRSGVLMWVSSGNTSAYFDLTLPIAEPGTEFVEYVAKIRPFLPVRLAKGNFKLCVPNKAGTGFVRKRVDASLLEGV